MFGIIISNTEIIGNMEINPSCLTICFLWLIICWIKYANITNIVGKDISGNNANKSPIKIKFLFEKLIKFF